MTLSKALRTFFIRLCTSFRHKHVKVVWLLLYFLVGVFAWTKFASMDIAFQSGTLVVRSFDYSLWLGSELFNSSVIFGHKPNGNRQFVRPFGKTFDEWIFLGYISHFHCKTVYFTQKHDVRRPADFETDWRWS